MPAVSHADLRSDRCSVYPPPTRCGSESFLIELSFSTYGSPLAKSYSGANRTSPLRCRDLSDAWSALYLVLLTRLDAERLAATMRSPVLPEADTSAEPRAGLGHAQDQRHDRHAGERLESRWAWRGHRIRRGCPSEQVNEAWVFVARSETHSTTVRMRQTKQHTGRETAFASLSGTDRDAGRPGALGCLRLAQSSGSSRVTQRKSESLRSENVSFTSHRPRIVLTNIFDNYVLRARNTIGAINNTHHGGNVISVS